MCPGFLITAVRTHFVMRILIYKLQKKASSIKEYT